MKAKTFITGAILVSLAIIIYGASRRSARVKSNLISATNSGLRMAPDFELRTLNGRTVKLSDFRGKGVVLNFWATYCGPCRVEMPWLRDLYKKYRKSGLEIIGVSMDDDGEGRKVSDFVRVIGVNYTILLGNHTVRDAYGGARFLPQTFFIDREGHIAASATGMKSKLEFENLINQLLTKMR